MSKFDFENLKNIVNRSNNSSQESSIRKIDSIIRTAENAIQAADYQKMKTISGPSLWGGDARAATGFGVKNAEKAFSDAMDKFVKTISDKNAKFEDVLEAQLSVNRKEVAIKAAESQKQMIIQRRMGEIGAATNIATGVGGLIGSVADFGISRERQRHQSLKMMNDVYIGGYQSLLSHDYMGLKTMGAYMSKEATDFGKSMGHTYQLSAGVKAASQLIGGAAMSFGTGSLMGGPALGGIAAATSLISGGTSALSGIFLDPATAARQARIEKASTMIEENRIKWELVDKPKFDVGTTLYRAERLGGLSGIFNVLGGDPALHVDVTRRNKQGNIIFESKNRTVREKQYANAKQAHADLYGQKPYERFSQYLGRDDLPTIEESGGWLQDTILELIPEWRENRKKVNAAVLTSKQALDRRKDHRWSKALERYGWIFGSSKEMARAHAEAAPYAATRKDIYEAGFSATAAMSWGIISSPKQYSQILGSVGAFSANNRSSTDMILSQFTGGSVTPAITEAITNAIIAGGQRSAGRGINLGAEPGLLLASTMKKNEDKRYSMYEVQKASSAIASLDSKLTSGQIDVGKIMASSTLSKAGIGGITQARLLDMDSSQIYALQRVANTGDNIKFQKKAADLGIHDVSLKQWNSANVASTLVGGAYTTGALFLGASSDLQKLLGMKGKVSAEEAAQIWERLPESEKQKGYQITGGQMGFIDATRATITGDVSNESALGKILQGRGAGGSGADDLRKQFANYAKEQNIQMSETWKEGDMKDIMSLLAADYDNLGKEDRKKFQLVAAQAAEQTFGFVSVTNMVVTNYIKK